MLAAVALLADYDRLSIMLFTLFSVEPAAPHHRVYSPVHYCVPTGGQPQVLHGQAGAIQIHLNNGIASQNMRTTTAASAHRDARKWRVHRR